jgi:hypothetical protein
VRAALQVLLGRDEHVKRGLDAGLDHSGDPVHKAHLSRQGKILAAGHSFHGGPLSVGAFSLEGGLP